MKNLNINTKGFINLNTLFILPVFIILYLTGTFAIALSQTKDIAQTQCLTIAAETQGDVLTTVRKLFYLNKASTALRMSITATNVSIAAAAVALQFHLLPPLRNTLKTLEALQKTLDTTQKAIIMVAKAQLYAGHMKLVFSVNKQMYEQHQTWAKFIQLMAFIRPTNQPALAIQPDSKGGVAPNYEWQKDAERLQTLSYSWMLFFTTVEKFQNYLNWTNRIKVDCAVSPVVTGEEWELKISTGKP